MDEYLRRIEKIAGFIRQKQENIPDTAVVLGSGLGAFGDSLKDSREISFDEIPDFPAPTVEGHKGSMIFGKVKDREILAIQGRIHAYEGRSMKEVTLYIRVLSLLGVKNLILTNAAGAINTRFTPGQLMLITDHFSLFCSSPLSGPNLDSFGPRFPSMSEAYSKELTKVAKEAAQELSIPLQEGVYCYTPGPTYETPAEIRALRGLGCDACGMSTVPETIVANHCGIRVLGISCITNMAAGISDKPLSHKEVMETGNAAKEKFGRLISAVCQKL